jgi:hypothetical protein
MTHTPGPIVIYEDRPCDTIGVKLLLLSLAEHEPQSDIHLYIPGMPRALTSWAGTRPGVRMCDASELTAHGWDVKPTLLLEILRQGYPEAIWLDSDVILTRPLRPVLAAVEPGAFVCAQEQPWPRAAGSRARTQAWGLRPGTDLPVTVNTGVLRATRDHVALLTDWQQLLEHPAYLAAQQRPCQLRPRHLMSDQDALTALLGSEPHRSVLTHSLRSGVDIAQCYGPDGYASSDRVRRAFRSLPPIIHAQLDKPWRATKGRPVHLELCPYRYAAQDYVDNLTPPERGWLHLHSRAARILHRASGGDPSLAGLPPALAAKARRGLIRVGWVAVNFLVRRVAHGRTRRSRMAATTIKSVAGWIAARRQRADAAPRMA